MAHNAGKKNLTPLYVGEKKFRKNPEVWERKILTQTKSP